MGRKRKGDNFGLLFPQMPKEFWAFFVIAIILSCIWKIVFVLLIACIIVFPIMFATMKDPNDPFSDWKK
jgi:hypothetical protein